MKYNLLLLVLLSAFVVDAQNTQFLQAFYSFDNCTGLDKTGENPAATFSGTASCACGVQDTAQVFSGDDAYSVTGKVLDFFSKNDMTVSLYVKPELTNETQPILSKRSTTCDNDNVFQVDWEGANDAFRIRYAANDFLEINLEVPRSKSACWQHLVISRDARVVTVFLNGEQVAEGTSIQVIDISNSSPLYVGRSNCSTAQFKGTIDDLKVFNTATSEAEANELFYQQGQLLNRNDTIIYLGGEVEINAGPSCVNNFSWSPFDGVSDVSIPNPVISPTSDGDYTYTLTGVGTNGCLEQDTIRIRVIDPDKLPCKAYFPNVFTPNGDGVNDRFKVLNEIAIDEILSFEVFDQVGNRVYFSASPNGAWDGSYWEQPVNPGVFYYRFKYLCKGEEVFDDGTVTLMR